jgi:hypothetical protein
MRQTDRQIDRQTDRQTDTQHLLTTRQHIRTACAYACAFTRHCIYLLFTLHAWQTDDKDARIYAFIYCAFTHLRHLRIIAFIACIYIYACYLFT